MSGCFGVIFLGIFWGSLDLLRIFCTIPKKIWEIFLESFEALKVTLNS
jgi:hypothetical protein